MAEVYRQQTAGQGWCAPEGRSFRRSSGAPYLRSKENARPEIFTPQPCDAAAAASASVSRSRMMNPPLLNPQAPPQPAATEDRHATPPADTDFQKLRLRSTKMRQEEGESFESQQSAGQSLGSSVRDSWLPSEESEVRMSKVHSELNSAPHCACTPEAPATGISAAGSFVMGSTISLSSSFSFDDAPRSRIARTSEAVSSSHAGGFYGSAPESYRTADSSLKAPRTSALVSESRYHGAPPSRSRSCGVGSGVWTAHEKLPVAQCCHAGIPSSEEDSHCIRNFNAIHQESSKKRQQQLPRRMQDTTKQPEARSSENVAANAKRPKAHPSLSQSNHIQQKQQQTYPQKRRDRRTGEPQEPPLPPTVSGANIIERNLGNVQRTLQRALQKKFNSQLPFGGREERPLKSALSEETREEKLEEADRNHDQLYRQLLEQGARAVRSRSNEGDATNHARTSNRHHEIQHQLQQQQEQIELNQRRKQEELQAQLQIHQELQKQRVETEALEKSAAAEAGQEEDGREEEADNDNCLRRQAQNASQQPRLAAKRFATEPWVTASQEEPRNRGASSSSSSSSSASEEAERFFDSSDPLHAKPSLKAKMPSGECQEEPVQQFSQERQGEAPETNPRKRSILEETTQQPPLQEAVPLLLNLHQQQEQLRQLLSKQEGLESLVLQQPPTNAAVASVPQSSASQHPPPSSQQLLAANNAVQQQQQQQQQSHSSSVPPCPAAALLLAESSSRRRGSAPSSSSSSSLTLRSAALPSRGAETSFPAGISLSQNAKALVSADPSISREGTPPWMPMKTSSIGGPGVASTEGPGRPFDAQSYLLRVYLLDSCNRLEIVAQSITASRLRDAFSAWVVQTQLPRLQVVWGAKVRREKAALQRLQAKAQEMNQNYASDVALHARTGGAADDVSWIEALSEEQQQMQQLVQQQQMRVQKYKTKRAAVLGSVVLYRLLRKLSLQQQAEALHALRNTSPSEQQLLQLAAKLLPKSVPPAWATLSPRSLSQKLSETYAFLLRPTRMHVASCRDLLRIHLEVTREKTWRVWKAERRNQHFVSALTQINALLRSQPLRQLSEAFTKLRLYAWVQRAVAEQTHAAEAMVTRAKQQAQQQVWSLLHQQQGAESPSLNPTATSTNQTQRLGIRQGALPFYSGVSSERASQLANAQLLLNPSASYASPSLQNTAMHAAVAPPLCPPPEGSSPRKKPQAVVRTVSSLEESAGCSSNQCCRGLGGASRAREECNEVCAKTLQLDRSDCSCRCGGSNRNVLGSGASADGEERRRDGCGSSCRGYCQTIGRADAIEASSCLHSSRPQPAALHGQPSQHGVAEDELCCCCLSSSSDHSLVQQTRADGYRREKTIRPSRRYPGTQRGASSTVTLPHRQTRAPSESCEEDSLIPTENAVFPVPHSAYYTEGSALLGDSQLANTVHPAAGEKSARAARGSSRRYRSDQDESFASSVEETFNSGYESDRGAKRKHGRESFDATVAPTRECLYRPEAELTQEAPLLTDESLQATNYANPLRREASQRDFEKERRPVRESQATMASPKSRQSLRQGRVILPNRRQTRVEENGAAPGISHDIRRPRLILQGKGEGRKANFESTPPRVHVVARSLTSSSSTS